MKHDMPIVGGMQFQGVRTENCLVCGDVAHRHEFELVGAHACLRLICSICGRSVIEDLPHGHALFYPFSVDEATGELNGGEIARGWYGEEFAKAVRYPATEEPSLEIQEHRPCSGEIVFLPCIDYLYGHSLLKLLQAGEHLDAGFDVVVLVPRYMAWMVPESVAQTWIVDVPLRHGQLWFPSLSKRLREKFSAFDCVRISPAHPHPAAGDPERFTKVAPYERQVPCGRRVTFVWRDDRLWAWDRQNIWLKVPRLRFLGRWIQKQRVLRLFDDLKRRGLDFVPTVVGVGSSPGFPGWVEDRIVSPPVTREVEMRICEVYAQSLAVVGVHGSNMLLPSWHALSTFDLMPVSRWGNFAQDILYRDTEPRRSAARLRYVALSTPISVLAAQVASMLEWHQEIFRNFESRGQRP